VENGSESPATTAARETDPSDSPVSNKVIVDIVMRANRPAPEWLVASAPGAVEPVKINCPFA